MKTVYTAHDPFDKDTYRQHQCVDVPAFLHGQYNGVWPENLRIYNGSVCDPNDVTPLSDDQLLSLNDLDGPFYALEMPADPGTALLIIGSIVVGVAATFALAPKPPVSTQRGAFNSPSPNNELSSRENKPRIGKRIPDIFGTVRSVPDLLAVPYNIFVNNVDTEIAYYCVGKGEYEITDIKDGDTLISEIPGASVEVYGPNNSPNLSSPGPDQTIGTAVGREVKKVERSEAVNGQTLTASSYVLITGNTDIVFNSNGTITDSLLNYDFEDFFSPGDVIEISNSDYTGASGSYNFDGTYTVSAVGALSITLDNPSSVNADWTNLANEPTGLTNPFSPVIENNSISVGPFIVGDAGSSSIAVNLVALNGLWKTDGETQQALSVNVRITISKSGETDNVTNTSISGSSVNKDTVGRTVEVTPSFSGPYSVLIERTSGSFEESGFSIAEEVKARDLYAFSDVSENDFGNVTTIMSQTRATSGALAVKRRLLNCIATRKIPKRNPNGTFTSNQTDYNARDVLIFIARDEYIGNRADSEIDMAGIATEIAANETYFGTSDGVEFSYTFDDDNISFEETFSLVADAVFCTAYREGDLLKVRLEKAQTSSSMLFNHRNIIPGSQRISTRFGNVDDQDGVEYDYISPDDDSVKTVFFPSDKSAVNPKRIESVGIRNDNQAYWHAARTWNKIRHQNVTQSFEGLEHALLLNRKERILIADNTRPDTQDGEVLAQNGLTLTLSQPFTSLGDDDYIWLMYNDGSVEVLDIEAGSTDYEVVLKQTPSGTIVSDGEKVIRTPYIIAGNENATAIAFMVDDIDPNGGSENTVNVKAVNYDSRYYLNDGDASPY